MTDYFFAFFAVLAGTAAFFGLPILTSLIFSSVSAGYIACLEIGFIPALCIRASTVLKGSLSFSHISSMVKPFIAPISAIYHENLKNARYFLQLLYKYVGIYLYFFKKSVDFFLYLLTKCRKYPILLYIG